MGLKFTNIEEMANFDHLVEHIGDGVFRVAPFTSEEVIKALQDYDKSVSALRGTQEEMLEVNGKIEAIGQIKNRLLRQPPATWPEPIFQIENFSGSPPVQDGVDDGFVYGTRHYDFLEKVPFLRLIGRHFTGEIGTGVFEIGQPIKRNRKLLEDFFEGQNKIKELQRQLAQLISLNQANAATVKRLFDKLKRPELEAAL